MNNPVRFIDPDGKEVLNGIDKSNHDNIPILKAVTLMRANEDPRVIHIYAHGDKDGFVYTDRNGKEHNISDSKGLVAFLNTNSKVWKNRKNNENITIVLHACQTGKETEDDPVSFAQELSNDKSMLNVTIIAPNTNIAVDNTGENERSVTVKRDKNGKVVSSEMGRYVEFKNGVKTNTYSGDSKVGSKGFNNNNTFEKIINYIKSVIN